MPGSCQRSHPRKGTFVPFPQRKSQAQKWGFTSLCQLFCHHRLQTLCFVQHRVQDMTGQCSTSPTLLPQFLPSTHVLTTPHPPQQPYCHLVVSFTTSSGLSFSCWCWAQCLMGTGPASALDSHQVPELQYPLPALGLNARSVYDWALNH